MKQCKAAEVIDVSLWAQNIESSQRSELTQQRKRDLSLSFVTGKLGITIPLDNCFL